MDTSMDLAVTTIKGAGGEIRGCDSLHTASLVRLVACFCALCCAAEAAIKGRYRALPCCARADHSDV